MRKAFIIEMTNEDSDSTQGHAPNDQSCLKWNGLECGGPLTRVVPAKVWRQLTCCCKRDWFKYNMAGQPPGKDFELEFLKKLFNKVTVFKDVCKAEGTDKNFDASREYLKLEGISTLFRHKEGSLIKTWRLEKEALKEKRNF